MEADNRQSKPKPLFQLMRGAADVDYAYIASLDDDAIIIEFKGPVTVPEGRRVPAGEHEFILDSRPLTVGDLKEISSDAMSHKGFNEAVIELNRLLNEPRIGGVSPEKGPNAQRIDDLDMIVRPGIHRAIQDSRGKPNIVADLEIEGLVHGYILHLLNDKDGKGRTK